MMKLPFHIETEVAYCQCYGYRFALHVGSLLILLWPADRFATRLELLTPSRRFRLTRGAP